MSAPETPVSAPPVPEPETAPAAGGSPLDAVTEHPTVQAHPEILVGAAFAGAFVAAKLLRAIGGGS